MRTVAWEQVGPGHQLNELVTKRLTEKTGREPDHWDVHLEKERLREKIAPSVRARPGRCRHGVLYAHHAASICDCDEEAILATIASVGWQDE